LPAHTILVNHRLYPISILVQNPSLNIQNLVYSLTLPNITCREPFIPPLSVPLTRNVMEQNLVGFPNSMYLRVGPYTPHFGFGYGGVRCVPTM
jgi:hypothetical protein